MIELTNISKSYSQPGSSHAINVLDGLSLSIGEGESVSIAGPSGSGKSTLLNIIGSLDKPTSGSITFRGNDLLSMDENAFTNYRSSEIGFVFQDHLLLPQLTLWENILLPTLAVAQKRSDNELQSYARTLIERVDLTDRTNHRPAQLSGGEKQRAAVIRAMINQPAIILADEPTGSLDRDNALNMGQLLLELNQEFKTALIVVTHSNQLAELFMNAYHLDHGKLIKT